MTDIQSLRRSLKQARQSLTTEQRTAAAGQAIERLRRLRCYRKARRIAAFIGSKGELDPQPLMRQALAEGKEVYLPVLHPFVDGRLWFCRWQVGTPMRANRFGIPEPAAKASSIIPVRHLDLVVVPLLGFDAACHRLGMGGGYYDRTFAFRLHSQRYLRPRLVGFAHEVQRIASLSAEPWDVRPDLIVTNERTYRCRR